MIYNKTPNRSKSNSMPYSKSPNRSKSYTLTQAYTYIMGADFCRHFSANAALSRQKNYSMQHPTARPRQCAKTNKDSLTSKICQNLTDHRYPIDDFQFAYTYIMGADIFRRRGRNIRRIRTETKTCTPTPQYLSAYQISFGSAASFSRSRSDVHTYIRTRRIQ